MVKKGLNFSITDSPPVSVIQPNVDIESNGRRGRVELIEMDETMRILHRKL
jgi:hypothetical protein